MMAHPEAEPEGPARWSPSAGAEQVTEEGLVYEDFAASFRSRQGDAPNTYGSANDLDYSSEHKERPSLEKRFRKVGNQCFSLCNFGTFPAVNVMVFVLMPWVTLTLVMWPFALGYHSLSGVAWLVFSFFMLLGAFFIWLDVRPSGHPGLFWKSLGCCVLFMSVIGMLLGLHDYHTYIWRYQVYQASPEYVNVVATQDPGAMQDAGSITFRSDSFVDVSRSLGHKDGDVFCVAPVLNHEIAAGKPAPGQSLITIKYWAVGLNCCSQRGSFDCGPGGGQPGGLVVKEMSPFATPLVPKYRTAVSQAAATFGVLAPADLLLVEWGTDKGARATELHDQGVQFFVRVVYIYILVVLGAALLGLTLFLDTNHKLAARIQMKNTDPNFYPK